MKHDPKSGLYLPILIALVIGICLSIVMNVFLSNKTAESRGFSNLFFQWKDRRIGESISDLENFSIIVTNNEPYDEIYLLTIESTQMNLTKELSLSQGQRANIAINLESKEKNWVINYDSEKEGIYHLSFDDRTELEEFGQYVDGWGNILFINLTREELVGGELSFLFSNRSVEKNSIINEERNLTFSLDESRLKVYSLSKRVALVNVRSPFIVTLEQESKGQNKLRRIHFLQRVD